ncbi:TetR/AcrR family transcriptional regulator [Mycobacterium sp. NPDC050551]|uniref:TetR/AcrR family transcriptional regulator n=1 Tax=Mycobacterium sp. NPDC050551 TaxID=3155407 RepID=UPI003428B06D
MTTPPHSTVTDARSPRDRILDVADSLFFSVGVRAVGVDRMVSEAGVARATFFKHFPTKDHLIAAYLERRAERSRATLSALRDEFCDEPSRVLTAIADVVDDYRDIPGFRGCEFINAAAEFADPSHPAHQLAVSHRQWVTDFLAGVLRDMGHGDADPTARAMMMVRTGALVGASLEVGVSDSSIGTALWNTLARQGYRAVVAAEKA